MYDYDGGRRAGMFPGLNGAVLMLLLWNGILFLLQHLQFGRLIEGWLGLTPALFWRGCVWQAVTYMFLHGSWQHILMNMLGVWLFGSQLEAEWGSRTFTKYYFFSGIGGGITQLAWQALHRDQSTVIGASGALFGLLLAYGVLFPDRKVLLWFVVAIPARLFVAGYGFIELVSGLSARANLGRPGVAHFAHLGGLLFGWIYIWLWGVPGGRIGLLRRRRMAKRRTGFQVIDFNDPDQRWRR